MFAQGGTGFGLVLSRVDMCWRSVLVLSRIDAGCIERHVLLTQAKALFATLTNVPDVMLKASMIPGFSFPPRTTHSSSTT